MTDTPTPQAPQTPAVSPQVMEQLRESSRGTLVERMGIELTEVSPQRCAGRMPVAGNTQPYGLLHGGASVVLAETLGSVASMLAAGPGRHAVGVDINATHHRAVRSGVVTGTATPAHVGRTTACFDVVITDEQGRRVCTSRITCALRDGDGGPTAR